MSGDRLEPAQGSSQARAAAGRGGMIGANRKKAVAGANSAVEYGVAEATGVTGIAN